MTEPKQQHDYEDQAQNAAREIAPSPAVAPSRQSGEQQEYEDDDDDQRELF